MYSKVMPCSKPRCGWVALPFAESRAPEISSVRRSVWVNEIRTLKNVAVFNSMWMSVIPVFILCSFLCFHPAVLYVTFIDFFDKLPCTKPVSAMFYGNVSTHPSQFLSTDPISKSSAGTVSDCQQAKFDRTVRYR